MGRPRIFLASLRDGPRSIGYRAVRRLPQRSKMPLFCGCGPPPFECPAAIPALFDLELLKLLDVFAGFLLPLPDFTSPAKVLVCIANTKAPPRSSEPTIRYDMKFLPRNRQLYRCRSGRLSQAVLRTAQDVRPPSPSAFQPHLTMAPFAKVALAFDAIDVGQCLDAHAKHLRTNWKRELLAVL